MDSFELLGNLCFLFAIAWPVCAVAAIALRVACHYSGVEIPAFGRAVALVLATVGPTAVLGYLFQILLVGLDSYDFDPVGQFVAILLTLLANLGICLLAYGLVLKARLGQALTVWLLSTVFFLLGGVAVSCVCGLPLYFLTREW